MMKRNASLLKRCLALAMALVLFATSANLGAALQAFAAEDDVTTDIATIVAKNYGLTEAEADLLQSGYLVSDSYGYTVPTAADGLVTVDTENSKIIAAAKDGWAATEAVITYGTDELTVALVDGEGTYDAEVVGNAFSVKVTYALTTTVDTSVQETLLSAAALLKQGVKNLDDVVAQAGNLYILEQAMPELVKLADAGVDVGFTTVKLSTDSKNAIYALNNQMNSNGGKLNLTLMIEECEAATKTGYLLSKGTEMQAAVTTLVQQVSYISESLNTIYDNIEWLIEEGIVDATLANQIKTLANTTGTLKDNLTAVSEDPWTAANSTDLVKADANYVALDALVAALGEITAVTVKTDLLVATTELQSNLAMWNVDVQVVLNTVNADNEVAEYNSYEATLTLADGATAEEIAAEIEANGVLANAAALFGDVLVEGKYDLTVTAIPETLTEDIQIVYTYAPKNYTVTIAGETAEYPYGYQLTLPVHADPTKSYDYKDANGKYYAQGTVVTVEDNMTFTREEGKSYTTGQLLQIIADNYGTDKAAAVLTSGALLVDETISYREPSKAELEELVKLEGNVLTVQSYASSYAGLNWTPYTYVVDGTAYMFNGASEVTIAGDFETVSVNYRLTLSNYSDADVKEILDLVVTLVDEAEGQKSVMDRLAGFEDQMSQLTKNMLNGLNGVIGGYSTENGGGLNSDPAKNDELVAYFQDVIGRIVKECTASNGYLKLYNVIQAYNDVNNGGLAYYYTNDEAVRAEVAVLSGYLNEMLDGGDRQAALEKLMTENGYGDKVDVLESLSTKLAEITAELAPVNAAINTTDAAKLSALAKALSAEGSVAYTEYGSPYIEMGPVVRTADKYVTIEVKAVVGNKNNTATVTIEKGQALTQAQVNELKDQVNNFVSGLIDTAFYTSNFNNGAELDALVGVELTEGAIYTYTWTAREYIVKIAGEADQIVTIENLTVTLPAHPKAANGMSYEYTVDGATANSGIYTFTKEQLAALFVDGTYTITRIEKNEAVEKLVKMVNTVNTEMGFQALTLVEEDGVYTGIVANMAAGDMMDFVMALVLKSGYGYIGLNNEGLIYENDKAELEISIQTLINAVLNDEDFSNDTIIALAENGKGELMTASMQLGSSASALEYTDLTFTMNLTSVPEQLTNNVDALKTVSNYVYAYSDNGTLAVEVNLPDQVYGAYAAALIATGNVDKTDVNALTQAVAINFLYDYVVAVVESDMDLVSVTNTLNMLGINRDVSGYNNYYTKAVDAYNNYVTVSVSDDGAAVDVSAPGATTINALLKLAGVDKDALSTYLTMIKEYKAGGTIDVSAVATVKNTDKTYLALIVDAQADGITNKFEAPSSVAALQNELKTLAGYSVVMLLDDVDGDLTISGTTVLDLNGKTVRGSITSTGSLYIIDSCMDTYNAGSAYAVSGNAVIFAGNYNADVSAYLKDGYYMDGTTVRNALYYITDMDGTVTFVLNGDVYEDEHVSGYLPNVKALAIDIASDLLINYALSASLTVEGYNLIDVKAEDLVGLYAGDTVNGLIKQATGWVTIGEAGMENQAGFEAVVNLILEDLLDFAAISDALANNTALVTYEIALAPWEIELDHIADGDYVTVNVGSNHDLEKVFNVALIVESKYNDALSALTGELANITEDETHITVDIPNPSYSDKQLTITGAGEAVGSFDLSKNEDYATMIGVILAYGNPAKAEAVAAAVNNNDKEAMKEVIDNTTVAEVFTALKVLSRNVNFAAMAAKVGVTKDVASAAELEAIYHVVLCGAGKVLEELDITGMNSKLGNLYNEETGYYELTKEDIFRDAEFSYRGYSALVELTAVELTLKVKLFGEDCLWGDANHDGIVNTDDAVMIEEYVVMDGNLDVFFCTIRTDVNADGVINTDDAALIREYVVGLITEFPAETK